MTKISLNNSSNQNIGKLYVVATPIGNMKDITYRAVEILSNVNLILCENTKNSYKLLSYYGIKAKMLPYNDHSKAFTRNKILAALARGEDIALISDAGTPLISDPGFKLIEQCKENNIKVIPIPGPSAVTTAISAAGLPTDKFLFVGFLPTKTSLIHSILKSLKDAEVTLIFYESPKRIYKTIQSIYQILGNRKIVIARELTKIYEEFIADDCVNFLNTYKDKQFKGEIVLMITGATPNDLKTVDITKILKTLLKDHSLKDSVEIAHNITGLNKKLIYENALKLK